jgi:hypothetical protein
MAEEKEKVVESEKTEVEIGSVGYNIFSIPQSETKEVVPAKEWKGYNIFAVPTIE